MVKLDITKKIQIPSNVQLDLNSQEIKVSGPKGNITKTFRFSDINVEKKDNEVILKAKKAAKKKKMLVNTIVSHIKNMIKGVTEGYVYELKILSGHFPITATKDGDKVTVKNYLGEKIPRTAKILQGVNVEISKDKIILTGHDKEALGETASNLERATKLLGNKDKRKFQDGIFLVTKAGKPI